jgi:hypothetical protein
MNINIEPHTVIDLSKGAIGEDHTTKLALEVYSDTIKHYWCILLANGLRLSVCWTDDEILTFLPKQNVSDVLKDWEENIDELVKTWQKAVETKIHPTWTRSEEVDRGHNVIPRFKKEYGLPYLLNESEVKSAQEAVERLQAKQGKMQLVKFTLGKEETINAKDVANFMQLNGKPTTLTELRSEGFSDEEIQSRLNKKPQAYGHLREGLVMQWYDGAWHGISVIVKANERFVWLQRWEDVKDETKKPTRILRHKVSQEGYSMMHCGYNGGVGSRYIGKILDLDKPMPTK